MPTIGTWWRTVRHLKLRQITGRLHHHLSRPAPDRRPPPAWRSTAGPWVRPAMREPSMVAPGRFRFLNVEGDLADLGWCGPRAEKLWRYNQHYFDDLSAKDAEHRRAWHLSLIERWIADNPAPSGDGWEPYPTSLRIVNWLKARFSGVELSPAAQASLAVQTRWLCRRLEWHLLGNHLFVNAKALIFAGLAFDGPEADAWIAKGLAILQEQLAEQVLPDGGQFERSPMYHALALEDVLDLINAWRHAAPDRPQPPSHDARWTETASRMLHWLRVMQHPDGRGACFNDSAHGIATPHAELERYAAALGIVSRQPPPESGVVHLPDTGYVRLAQPHAVCFVDVAPVGPSYLPGHAHADTLSFELSLHGRRVIVNGGTSVYGAGPRRLQERGTASHSTVQVAGQNSSEVWSGFRVGRRAYPRDVRIERHALRAAHDGYTWLPGKPLHRRSWAWAPRALQVEDEVTVPTLPALARYHLAPGLQLCAAGPTVWQVLDASEEIARVIVITGKPRVEPSTHAPEFGVVLDTCCLAVELVAGRAQTRWQWA